MLLPGRVADDAWEPSVEFRRTLNLDTEHWIRNTGMHGFANQPTKELTKGGDLREAQVVVPLSSYFCVLTLRWAPKQTPYTITGIRLR
jgi:hypothetical protein